MLLIAPWSSLSCKARVVPKAWDADPMAIPLAPHLHTTINISGPISAPVMPVIATTPAANAGIPPIFQRVHGTGLLPI